MEEKEIGENYNIKITFNNQDIDLSIDSKFDSFIKKIFNILQISLEEINSFGLSYTDEDGDNILITTEDDYKIFFQQVKEKLVNHLIIEKNDNKKNDDNLNQIKENINNESNLQYSNKSINNSQNKINISNSYINNNNISYYKNNNFENSENNKSNKIIPNKDKEDVPIENIVYYYKCSSCSTYPIVCVMYYCDKCNLYLCENCEKNNDIHEHGLIKIKNKDQLVKIKDEENEKIDQKNKMKEQLNNNNYKNYLNNNDNNNDNNNYRNSHHNNNINKNKFLNNNNNIYTNQKQPLQSYYITNQSCGNNQNNNYNYQRNNNNSNYINRGRNLSSFHNNNFQSQNNYNEFYHYNHLNNSPYNHNQFRIYNPQVNYDCNCNRYMGNNLRYNSRPLMNETGQTNRIRFIGGRYYI